MIRKWFSTEERQNFVGPAVVGSILGAFAAYAVFALDSEYKLQTGGAPTTLQTATEAAVAFLVCVLGTVAVLGLVPVLIARRRSRQNSRRAR